MLRLFIATNPNTQADWEARFLQALSHAQIIANLDELKTLQDQSPDQYLSYYAILWNTTDQVWQWVLQPATQPKAIFLLGAGVDKVLSQIQQQFRGTSQQLPPIVRLENAGMADSMVEYTLYAVLESFRGFRTYKELQNNRQWQALPPPYKEEFPIGVLGLGALGQPVALALAGLGFPVIGWSSTGRTIPGLECVWGLEGLDHILDRSKLIVLLLPLTEETKGLLHAQRLNRLPPGAVIVNLARGALIEEQGLLDHLQKDSQAHCYLDVFTQEPLPIDHPFWNHGQITLTPHISAQTKLEPGVAQIVDKIQRLEQGLEVSGVVDLDRGY
jgi:glyoxylate/hydroxypyruvate reductase A